jgi:hypothetical protein
VGTQDKVVSGHDSNNAASRAQMDAAKAYEQRFVPALFQQRTPRVAIAVLDTTTLAG